MRDTSRAELLLSIFLIFTTLPLAAQKPGSVSSAEKAAAALSTGPFHIEPDAVHPVFMDYLNARPLATSPDGKLGVIVTGPKLSYQAWVTISPSTFPDGPVQVWPIQVSARVLWRPDSQAFALTDDRYANRSYVLVFGTEFRMGDGGPGLGVAITDLTPIVEEAFHKRADEYYAGRDNDAPSFYATAIRWVGNEQLLVGVSALSSGPPTFPNRGIMLWDVAYVVDVPSRKVVREVGKDELLSQYKITVPECVRNESWCRE